LSRNNGFALGDHIGACSCHSKDFVSLFTALNRAMTRRVRDSEGEGDSSSAIPTVLLPADGGGDIERLEQQRDRVGSTLVEKGSTDPQLAELATSLRDITLL
jgi:hypothetical protein